MKYKEAAEMLVKAGTTDMIGIEVLYGNELFQRIKLRSHGADKASMDMAMGILKEMDGWIAKVCREIGWDEEACNNASRECRSTAATSMALAARFTDSGVGKTGKTGKTR